MNSVSLVPWKAFGSLCPSLQTTAAAQHRPSSASPTSPKFVSNSLLSPDKIVLTGNIVAVKTVIIWIIFYGLNSFSHVLLISRNWNPPCNIIPQSHILNFSKILLEGTVQGYYETCNSLCFQNKSKYEYRHYPQNLAILKRYLKLTNSNFEQELKQPILNYREFFWIIASTIHNKLARKFNWS